MSTDPTTDPPIDPKTDPSELPLPLLGGGGGLKQILKNADIQEPKLSVLLGLPHITVEYAEAHIATAPNIRLAIYRMEKEWRMPILEPEQDFKQHIPPRLEGIIKR